MIYNYIPVQIGEYYKVTGPSISYQYDVKQFLVLTGAELPAFFLADFCNEGDTSTMTMTGEDNTVEIPDAYLQTGKRIKVFIVVTGTDTGASETRIEITLPVNPRPVRTDIEPTPEEQNTIDSLIEALNDGVDRAENAASAAEDSEENAEASATLAESYAVGGTGTRQGEDLDNSKFYSEVAEQAAGQAGWVYFYIDDEGYLHYVRTENCDLAFYIDASGLLHVTNGRT